MEHDGPSDVSFDDAEIVHVAAQLDRVASESTRYRRHVLAREVFLQPRPGLPSGMEADDDSMDEELGEGLMPLGVDEDDDAEGRLPTLHKAAWWAMCYHAEISVELGKERVRMEPNFRGPDTTQPPETHNLSETTVAAWSALAEHVATPAARGTLNHLLFQAGRGAEHARRAVEAYVDVANAEARISDAVHAARVAVRLARAVNDAQLHSVTRAALEAQALEAIDGDRRSVGAARDALGSLVRDNAPAARNLIDRACAAWTIGDVGDVFWRLKLKVVETEEDRRAVWIHRVETYIAMSDQADSNIMKAMRLRQALEMAEQSGLRELRERATILVQQIRHLDLEMMHITASSHEFEEVFEETIATILRDVTAAEVLVEDTVPMPGDVTLARSSASTDAEAKQETDFPAWYVRLNGFANFEAPTGIPDSNREVVANQRRLAPLQSLFPIHLQTPEGLPLYAPRSDEERFDLDLVRWETQLLEQWSWIMAEALRRVVSAGMPPAVDLISVLVSNPVSTPPIARQLASSFGRFWTGDSEGAAYTALPAIEAMVRNAVIAADRGVFRLQRNQQPGQYVGLGTLLDLFAESYAIPERDLRFFGALLRHPGGWNLRNLAAHGYTPGIDGAAGAVILYAAVRIIVLTAGGPAAHDDPESD